MANSAKRLYCICRSSNCDEFMICCDECEEWYHGKCIGVSQAAAMKIEEFYCELCRKNKPMLQIVYKAKVAEKRTFAESEMTLNKPNSYYHDPDYGEEEALTSQPRKKHIKVDRCGQCIGCFRNANCNKCEECLANRHCVQRRCVNFDILSTAISDSLNKHKKAAVLIPESSSNSQSRKGPQLKQISRTTKFTNKSQIVSKYAGKDTRANTKQKEQFYKEAGINHLDWEEPVQCWGPGCILIAKDGSKYCSEACGIEMAKQRLIKLLPAKLEQADRIDACSSRWKLEEEKLEIIKKRSLAATEALNLLNEKEKELDALVEAAKDLQPIIKDNSTDSESEEPSGEHCIYCPCCGHQTRSKTAMRHINNCFTRIEAVTSYGSVHKTQHNPYNLFCDVYNKVNHTYCRRLRVICPEHSRDTRNNSNNDGCATVCGYPLSDDQTSAATINLCREPKKECNRHYKWDKLRRALIDMQRLSLLVKADELFEEEKIIRNSRQKRNSVVALLLHDTTLHF